MDLRDYEEYARKASASLLYTGVANNESMAPALMFKDGFRIDYTGLMRNVDSKGQEEFLMAYLHLWIPVEGIVGLEQCKVAIDVIRERKASRASCVFSTEDVTIADIIESLRVDIQKLLND